jgi:hypothetical protein
MWFKIKLILGDIWDFIQPFVIQLLTTAGRLTATIATQVVLQAAIDAKAGTITKDGIRDYARDLAIEKLKAEGIQVGVDIATSFLNTCLETALQKLKADGQVE